MVTDGFRTSAVVEIKHHDASESCEKESVIYEDLKPPMVQIIHEKTLILVTLKQIH